MRITALQAFAATVIIFMLSLIVVTLIVTQNRKSDPIGPNVTVQRMGEPSCSNEPGSSDHQRCVELIFVPEVGQQYVVVYTPHGVAIAPGYSRPQAIR